MMKSENDNTIIDPIIIIGTGRSGTTLMGNILNQHPALLFVDEPRFLSDIVFPYAHGFLTRRDAISRLSIINDGSGKEPMKFLRRTFEHYSNKFSIDEYNNFKNATLKNVKSYLMSKSNSNLPIDYQHIRQLYNSINRSLSMNVSGRWVIKQPDLSNHIYDLFSLFPNGKFIHVLRDLRDVISSRLSNQFQLDLKTAMNVSTTRLKNIIEFDNLNPNTIKHIQFEELIEKPKLVVDQVIDFINIENSASITIDMIKRIDLNKSNIGRGQSLSINEKLIIEKQMVKLNSISSGRIMNNYL